MDDSCKQSINNLLPKEPHCAIICGQTGCGKTAFILDILQSHYRDVFIHIIILCPTLNVNNTYLSRDWVMNDPGVYKVDPGDRLQDCGRVCHEKYKGESTLFIIDDCSASKELTKRKAMLSYLALSGRHTQHSVWALTQKYNSVLKDLREQTKWVALFHCKDGDSFEECLHEIDVIYTKSERDKVRKLLASTKHCKLVLKNDQPASYAIA